LDILLFFCNKVHSAKDSAAGEDLIWRSDPTDAFKEHRPWSPGLMIAFHKTDSCRSEKDAFAESIDKVRCFQTLRGQIARREKYVKEASALAAEPRPRQHLIQKQFLAPLTAPPLSPARKLTGNGVRGSWYALSQQRQID
jgi:hypothetical protein